MKIKRIKSLDKLNYRDLATNNLNIIMMLVGMSEKESIFVTCIEEYEISRHKHFKAYETPCSSDCERKLIDTYFEEYKGNSAIFPEGIIKTSFSPEEKIMKGTKKYQEYYKCREEGTN